MKRDWDLIRQILLEVEELEPLNAIEFRDKSDLVNKEHCALLLDAGFLSGSYRRGENGPLIGRIVGMTWEGYELLSSIRDDSVWGKVKSKMAKLGGQVTIEVLKTLATVATKQALEIQ